MDQRWNNYKQTFIDKTGKQYSDDSSDSESASEILLDENKNKIKSDKFGSDESDSEIISNEKADENSEAEEINDYMDLLAKVDKSNKPTERIAIELLDYNIISIDNLTHIVKTGLDSGRLLSIIRYPTKEYLKRLEEEKDGVPREFKQNVEGDDSEILRKANKSYYVATLGFWTTVAVFDSVETAQKVFNFLEGVEFGTTGLRLNMRFMNEYESIYVPKEHDKLIVKADISSMKTKSIPSQSCELVQASNEPIWDKTPAKKILFSEEAFDCSDHEISDVEDYFGGMTESEFSMTEGESDEDDENAPPIRIPRNKPRRTPIEHFREALGLSLNIEDESKSEIDFTDEEESMNISEEEEMNISGDDEEINGYNEDYAIKEDMDCDDSDGEDADDESDSENVERKTKKVKKGKTMKIKDDKISGRQKLKMKNREEEEQLEKERKDNLKFMTENARKYEVYVRLFSENIIKMKILNELNEFAPYIKYSLAMANVSPKFDDEETRLEFDKIAALEVEQIDENEEMKVLNESVEDINTNNLKAIESNKKRKHDNKINQNGDEPVTKKSKNSTHTKEI